MPKQPLSLDFLIIGGGVSGLSCAIGLRRSGHRVVVLDKEATYSDQAGPRRMVPNLSKIFYHWGLGKQLKEITYKTELFELYLFETGQHLSLWKDDEELLNETGGDLLFVNHDDLRRVLGEYAASLGVTIRTSAWVESVDVAATSVTLQSGETLRADIIVGADGPSGVTRGVLAGPNEQSIHVANLCAYSASIPKNDIMTDPDLANFYTLEPVSIFKTGRCKRSHLSDKAEFNVYLYHLGNERFLEISNAKLKELTASSLPMLRRLVKRVTPGEPLPIYEYKELEDWVSHRLVLIGEAAHPLPIGSAQACPLAVEDGAVLGKLFSHLKREDQISGFLAAFQELRQARTYPLMRQAFGAMRMLTLPADEQETYRREMHASEHQVITDIKEMPHWHEVADIFSYNAEDDADNWWVSWGLLKERAEGIEVESPF
ncbi:FAD/NAD(P)-binding domain-containing protein [Fistulina hepatica ATCC 64428]|uniref:FAD/NAD(P)-binding domain-containing protein n=1 Tax=Fistulina hepatica ATCC 64428 TaxID=1128425 RepID=A0A0D7AMP5_9AGAR|nr:FAD/NAD(P)-binding domain-containing protein [Fistulina hepatica ATCC 64428]